MHSFPDKPSDVLQFSENTEALIGLEGDTLFNEVSLIFILLEKYTHQYWFLFI